MSSLFWGLHLHLVVLGLHVGHHTQLVFEWVLRIRIPVLLLAWQTLHALSTSLVSPVAFCKRNQRVRDWPERKDMSPVLKSGLFGVSVCFEIVSHVAQSDFQPWTPDPLVSISKVLDLQTCLVCAFLVVEVGPRTS